MKQQLPTSHDRHDAMLIVRLYDADVSERERALANALLAECRECAELFADLGAIASATRGLPTPPRPRDFILTEADAVRLGRPDGTPVRAPGGWAWVNLRRSLGGALAALGLVGVLLTGAGTFATSHAARFSNQDTSGSNAIPAAQPMPATGAAAATAAPAQPELAGPTPGSQSAQLPEATARTATSNATPPPAPASSRLDLATAAAATTAASPAPQQTGGNKAAATPPVPTTAPAADGGQVVVAAPSGGYGYDNGSGTSGGSTLVPASKGGSGGFDLGGVAFAGFALALLAGLGLLFGPALLRFAHRAR